MDDSIKESDNIPEDSFIRDDFEKGNLPVKEAQASLEAMNRVKFGIVAEPKS